MTQTTPELVEKLFDFLCRKYTQRSDARQQAMGLQYTTAETRDLAEEIARFLSRASPPPIDNNLLERAKSVREWGTLRWTTEGADLVEALVAALQAPLPIASEPPCPDCEGTRTLTDEFTGTSRICSRCEDHSPANPPRTASEPQCSLCLEVATEGGLCPLCLAVVGPPISPQTDDLTREIAEALEPFAKLTVPELWGDETAECTIWLRDIANAKAALAKLKASPPSNTQTVGHYTGVNEIQSGNEVIRSPETPDEVAAGLTNLAWKTLGGHYTMDGSTVIAAARMIAPSNKTPAVPLDGAQYLRDLVADDVKREGAMASTLVRAGLLLDILDHYLGLASAVPLDEQGATDLLNQECARQGLSFEETCAVEETDLYPAAIRAIIQASKGEGA